MRKTGKATLLAVAVLSIGLTGCNGSNGPTPGGSTSAGASGTGPGASGSATTSAPGGGTGTGTAASCLVGTWRTTGMTGTLSGGGVEGNVQGGSGVAVTIAPDGKTAVNFDGMQPVEFAFRVASSEVKGKFTYGGRVNGVVRTPAADQGKFEPTGTTDWNTLTVTVDLTAPAAVRVADKVSIAQFAGTDSAETGGAVDAQPILRNSTYKCGGNKLELTPATGTPATGTWVLTKA
jgi:hypothetical protein